MSTRTTRMHSKHEQESPLPPIVALKRVHPPRSDMPHRLPPALRRTLPSLAPVTAPTVELVLQLISDIGPEVAVRWLLAGSVTQPLTPPVYRALLSAILRAATFSEATLYLRAYSASVARHCDSPAAILGFSAETEPDIAFDVVRDLLQSASRDHPLLPGGPALSFYSSAGAGSGDSEEYHYATVDHRAPFCVHNDSLTEVRSKSLAIVINVFADAIKNKKAGSLISEAVSRFSLNNFLSPLIELFPGNVDKIEQDVCSALCSFFGAVLKTCSSSQRDALVPSLANAVLRIAVERPENITLYLGYLPRDSLRFEVSRLCLMQRFCVTDKATKTLTWATLDKYFKISVEEGRPNAAVPALLASLLEGWMFSASSRTFKVDGGERKVGELAKKIRTAKSKNWSQFSTNKRDVQKLLSAFMLVLTLLVT